MAGIDKRLDDLEAAMRPAGRLYVAWPMDGRPGLWEVDGRAYSLDELRGMMQPEDDLVIVEYGEVTHD